MTKTAVINSKRLNLGQRIVRDLKMNKMLWMMAIPLLCIPHVYAQTLIWSSILVLIVWEYRFRRYPERFWFGSNRSLQCAYCTEQLCRYKVPRSPRFRQQKTTVD